MQFDYKRTSELTQSEIRAMLFVLNEAFEGWGDEGFFRWKFVENPFGDSLHMIAYDDGEPVATVGFWRNGPSDVPAYQCVDAAVRPSHQRRGIYQAALNGCSERLEGAYIYTFTSDDSRPSMMKCGWTTKYEIPLKFNFSPMVLRKYRRLNPIPEVYAEWRFVRNPKKEYYQYRRYGLTFVLTKRREHFYAVGGVLSKDLGLKEVQPILLCSYDGFGLPFKIPRPTYYFIENSIYISCEDYIPSHHSDTF